MKKFLSIVFATLLVMSLAIPCMAANTEENLPDSKVIHVDDYLEFYNNQEYYKDLSAQGYTIIIFVGEEFAEMESERIKNEAIETHELVETLTRGSAAPTEGWNIRTNGRYEFEGSGNYSIRYFDFFITGWDGYSVSIHNLSNTNYLTGSSHGDLAEYDFEVPPQSTILNTYLMYSVSSPFYLSFNSPSYFEGVVSTYTYQKK